MRAEQHAPGDVIFKEGERSERAFLLRSGRVRLVGRQPAEVGLRVVLAGDIFGEIDAFAGTLRESTAIALTPCEVTPFAPSELAQLLSAEPTLAADLVRRLVFRASNAETKAELLQIRDPAVRIVLGLLRSAQSGGRAVQTEGGGTRLDISPFDLAALTGLGVEGVRSTVLHLRDTGYLQVSDESLEVPSIETLAELNRQLQAGEGITGSTPDA